MRIRGEGDVMVECPVGEHYSITLKYPGRRGEKQNSTYTDDNKDGIAVGGFLVGMFRPKADHRYLYHTDITMGKLPGKV